MLGAVSQEVTSERETQHGARGMISSDSNHCMWQDSTGYFLGFHSIAVEVFISVRPPHCLEILGFKSPNDTVPHPEDWRSQDLTGLWSCLVVPFHGDMKNTDGFLSEFQSLFCCCCMLNCYHPVSYEVALNGQRIFKSLIFICIIPYAVALGCLLVWNFPELI